MRIDKLNMLQQPQEVDMTIFGTNIDNNANSNSVGSVQGVSMTTQPAENQNVTTSPIIETPQNPIPAENRYLISDKYQVSNGDTTTTNQVRTIIPDNNAFQEGIDAYNQNITIPQQKDYDIFKMQINDLYQRLNPYNPEPIRNSRDLAQLQALATALGDLGKALGKDAGNHEGLGMVTIDKSDYDTLRKEALKYRDAYNQALREQGIQDLQRQISLLQQEYNDKNANRKGAYSAGLKAKADYESKNYDQTKSGKTNGYSRATTWGDKNSQEYKDAEEAKRIARIHANARYVNAIKGRGQGDDDEYLLSNIMFNNPQALSSYGKKRYDTGDQYFIDMVENEGFEEFSINKQTLGKFYNSIYPTLKKIDKDIKKPTVKPDEQVQQIQQCLSIWDNLTDTNKRREFYEAYNKAMEDSGLTRMIKEVIKNK